MYIYTSNRVEFILAMYRGELVAFLRGVSSPYSALQNEIHK